MPSGFIKEYFTFSKSDKIAVVVLLAIIVLLIGINSFISKKHQAEVLDVSRFQKDIAEYENSLQLQKKKKDYNIKPVKPKKNKKIQLFNFNPNQISQDSLELLGLSPFQAENLIKYRNAGGVFYETKDLKKIYGISENLYHELLPYVLLDTVNYSTTNDAKGHFETEKIIPTVVELNQASEDQLKTIKGIGDVYAKRIIKYRDLLGGFHNKQQLTEVYGLSDDILSNIGPMITIDTSKITRIDLNKSEFKNLVRHPYINKYMANAIMAFKNSSKNNITPGDLIKNNLLDSLNYQRIKLYLE